MMNPQKTEQDTLLETLDLARLAPSIHNSQPWRWRLEPGAVRLYADLRRWLPVTDQDGRDLVLSCGAALHHLRVALAAFGIAARVHRMPDPDEPDLLAIVTLDREAIAESGLGSVEPICRRRTDRRRFNTWPVPEQFLGELVQRAAEQGAVLRVVSDLPTQRELVAAIAAAASAQAGTPGYAEETAAWSGRADTPDGIPSANVPRADQEQAAVPMRDFRDGGLEQSTDTEDGAVLLALGTSSDDRLSQLRAGEATSAVLLRATELELATCPLSQPLEVADTRETLREVVLHGTLSPQLILRIGWPPAGLAAIPPTPRRPLTEIVEMLA
jgi:nitroreductase